MYLDIFVPEQNYDIHFGNEVHSLCDVERLGILGFAATVNK
jgi:hypothetical protein